MFINNANLNVFDSQENFELPDIHEGLEYISPECVEDKIQSKAMDLWALGCLIFEMVTGRKAFKGKTKEDLIQAIVSGNIDWGDDREKLSPQAIDLIIKLT